jgi:signal transduction histidine kinase
MSRLSLRTRLTAWYSVALFVVLGLFGADVVWQQSRIGLRRIDRELEGLTVTLANVARDEVNEGATAPENEALALVTAPGRALAILDEQGRPISAMWNGLSLPGPLPDANVGARAWNATTSTGIWRVHARTETFGERRFVLVAATPLADVLRERHEVLEAMWVGIPLVLLLATGGGLWLASIGLRPITAMAARASRIPLSGMDDLGESDRHDELGQLARAFNGLVARLRTALRTQRQFMADASHELRTPVSVIRSAADVTLSRGHREEDEYREALSIVDGQARRVTRLVDDMLVLARADAGGYPLRPEHLYLDDLMADVRRTVALLATERRVGIDVVTPIDVSFDGDEDLLRRMLLNVVQNAVQHTPPEGVVSIGVAVGGRSVDIQVTNPGVAIPVAERERIFERFVQLDPARRATGSGLGLPIARWIAEAHGGTLVLTSTGPTGTTFTATLPA